MRSKEHARPITFSYKTLGCKVNQAESDEIAEALIARGLKESVSSRSSVSIINTCAVTSLSEQKCRQAIRNIRKNDPDTMIVVTGCYAGEQKAQDALRDTVDIFLSNKEKGLIAEKVLDRLELDDHFLIGYLDADAGGGSNFESRSKRTRALLKAQDGCDQFCGYCAVPFYRSDLSWRPIEDLERQCNTLIAAGVREIVLTGTNLSLYGAGDIDRDASVSADSANSDLAEVFVDPGSPMRTNINAPSIAEALNRLGSLAGNYRLRLSSLEVNDRTLGLADELKADLKLARHFHIPIQSGSDSVLEAMGRRSLTTEMRHFIESLRAKFPGSSITTDVIVGFPGETEDDVDQTIKFLSEIRPLKVHIFKYSERPGTKAAESKGRVPERVRKERSIRVRKAMYALRAEVLREMIGKKLEVLIEKKADPSIKAGFVGYSSEYVRVIVQGASVKVGEMVMAEIVEVCGDDLLSIFAS